MRLSAFRKAAPAAGVLVALACGQDRVRHAAEDLQVVGGSPTVGTGLPGVDRLDGGADANVWGPAAPFQVDSFDQPAVQKVDILWVVDNSSSMQAKQQRLAANLHNFMSFLNTQKVDYHLGVVSTDTFDPKQSGRLQNNAGLPQPWINADAGANADSYFVTNVGLGELGTGDEKGLLGGMMALTPPLSPASNANPDAGAQNCARLLDGGVDCFLRKDAALYTVIISDEEDSSCSPLNANNQKEGCADSDIRTQGGYGTTDYWNRFYAGAKGLGGISRVAAIVATDTTVHDCAVEFAGFCDSYIGSTCTGNNVNCNQNVSGGCCTGIASCELALHVKSQFCHTRPFPTSGGPTTGYSLNGSWAGCKSVDSNGKIDFTAYYAPRYAGVAAATGGIATSICDADYTPALAKLGLQASGLRSDFPLSRAPISTSISVLVTPPGGQPALVPAGAGTWQYVACENQKPVNLIRFTDTARPVSGSRIAASYDVNTQGIKCP